MTKLIYPAEGLVGSQSKNMENAKKNLEKTSQTNLDIPRTFASREYLNVLLSDINDIVETHNKFQELLEKNDTNYQNVGNEIANNFKGKNNIKIPKRNKII